MKHLAKIQSEFLKVSGRIMGPGIPDGTGPYGIGGRGLGRGRGLRKRIIRGPYSGKTENLGIPDGTGPMKDDPSCMFKQTEESEDQVDVNVNANLKGFITDIEKDTVENNNFRKVLYTGKTSQLVLMSLKPNEDIGEEVHNLDQFFRIDEGLGKVIINGTEHSIKDGSAFIVPAQAKHNVIAGDEGLKLYSVYSPANHKDKTLHKTKEEAVASEEHFDGETTE